MSHDRSRIVHVSWFDPEWNWLANQLPAFTWVHHSSHAVKVPRWLPFNEAMGRAFTALRAALDARRASSVLVSHGPLMAMFCGLWRDLLAPQTPHLVFAFNFTHLPGGMRQRLMRWAFRRVTQFTVFSNFEREVYARHFGIPHDRFVMMHWSARPLQLPTPRKWNTRQRRYICAVGSQGRDYGTLLQAMEALPDVSLVLVANPDNLVNQKVPNNVEVLTHVPLDEVADVIDASAFMVLPLLGTEIPCGHVTLVSAMHQGKAIVVTDSQGVSDYVCSEINGALIAAGDVQQWVSTIHRLWSNSAEADRLGEQGRALAQTHCTEAAATAHLEAFLQRCKA
jgi:glycosyltransferase involved in cell wall biosynthesis